jgi:hypothetical protein
MGININAQKSSHSKWVNVDGFLDTCADLQKERLINMIRAEQDPKIIRELLIFLMAYLGSKAEREGRNHDKL